MLTLIYGKDSYRVCQKIKEIENNFKEEKGFVVFFDGKDDIREIKKEISQDSIFKEKKLVVLKNCWFLIEKNKEFLSLLEKLSKSKIITIVLKEEKVSKKTESFFKKQGEIFNFELLDNQSLIRWIKKEINKKKGKITEKAIGKLTLFMGNNLWSISNEIDKLVAYKKDELIEEKDVDLLTVSKVEGDIFKAIDFLATRKRKQALEIFYKHIKKGDHALYLITMIAFQFRNLLLVKKNDKSDAKELGMHPFVFQKSLRQSNFFSETELKEIYKKILKSETDIKTGRTTPEFALDFLISEI